MADTDNWRHDLIDRYPHMFADSSGRISGYPSVHDGWRDLLERLFARIEKVMKADPEGSLHVLQIKEKFSALRFYYYAKNFTKASKDTIELAVALAEARSACTCEACGDEGDFYDKGGWYLTRCPAHAQGKLLSDPPGWKNLSVIRFRDRDGKLVVQCRRYDRETDSFTEVDPNTVPGLKDED